MTEKKFIDLEDEIGRDVWGYIANGGQASLVGVLRWLDDHPETIPAPAKHTITEGELREAWDRAAGGDLKDPIYKRFAFELGIAVAADPEPTNAERLETVLSGLYGALREAGIDSSLKQRIALAESLDGAGVTAPGGEGRERV